MPERSSRSVQETRDREAWLNHLLESDPEKSKELGSLLATATITRAAVDGIEVPQGAEEKSYHRALAQMDSLEERPRARLARAPWYVRLGGAMRFVFTLGRRR